MYVSEHLTCSSCTTLPPVQGSDHNSIVLTLGKTQLIAKKHTRRKIWLYKRVNFEEANTTLQCIPSICLPANDVDSLWSQWYTFFMSTMSIFIPSKTIKPNQRLPYITDSLKCDIQRKLKLYKEAKRLNTDRVWSKYNKARNKATANLRSAKAKFFKSLASQLNSPKNFWTAYHKLSPKKTRISTDLKQNNTTARSSSAKANLLNQFFSSCFSPPSKTSTSALPTSPGPKLRCVTCNEAELHKILTSLKSQTASGSDGILSQMLQPSSTFLSNRRKFLSAGSQPMLLQSPNRVIPLPHQTIAPSPYCLVSVSGPKWPTSF